MRQTILRTQDIPHSHRVAVMVVERDTPLPVHIALSSPGCAPPYEPRGTDATVYYWSPGSSLSLPSISPRWIVDTFVSVLVVSSSTPHHYPFVPSSLFPSVPALSPDCFSAIFISALSASLG